MSQFREFEEMRVWQEARKLTCAIRSICKQSHVCKDFDWVRQIMRSARSVGANLAEGSDSLTAPEFINFLGFAKRSAAETRAHLYDGLDGGYLSQEQFNELAAQSRKICHMIAKLIHHLQSLDPKRKRTYSDANKPINQ